MSCQESASQRRNNGTDNKQSAADTITKEDDDEPEIIESTETVRIDRVEKDRTIVDKSADVDK
jgi:hypothetical protein